MRSTTRHLRWLLAAGVIAGAAVCAPLLSALAGTAPKSFGDARSAAALPFMTCDTLILDFNGDGRPEFAGGNHFAPGFGIAVNATPRAGATPVFSKVVNVTLPEDAGRSAGLFAADVNADGRPDLASSNHKGTLSVVVNATARGSQDLRFSQATTVELGAGKQIGAEGSGGGVVAADFDLDGRPDFATANFGNSSVSVVPNRTARGARTARLASPVRFDVGAQPIAIAAGDIDGDRRPDIVSSNLRAGTVSVLLNRSKRGAGEPRFGERQDVRVGDGPTFSALADFNADGRLDIVSSDWSDTTVTVVGNYTRPGSERVRLRVDRKVQLRSHGLIIRAADLDGDRRPDLAVFPFDPPSQLAAIMIPNRTSRRGAPASFGRPQSYALPNLDRSRKHYSATGAVGDLNGDGALEMSAGVVDARFAPSLGDDFYTFISDPALANPPKELLPDRAEILVMTNGD